MEQRTLEVHVDLTGLWPRRVNLGAWALAIGLMGWSLYLALTRIYQVDEAQNLYMCRVVALGRQSEFFSNAAFFFFGPLRWLAAGATSSASLFRSARILFWGLFWFNVFMAWRCAGGRFRSLDGGGRLIFLASLAPWWDYGFEIRHDNLILTGVLVLWWLSQRKAHLPLAFSVMGFVSAWMQLTAFKSFLFWVPLGLAMALLSPQGRLAGRWRCLLVWAGGLALGFLGGYGLYRQAGLWNTYLQGLSGGVSSAMGGQRFWPWFTLTRLFAQTPFLLAGLLAATLGWGRFRAERRPGAWGWSMFFPELLLSFGGLLVLFVNPTPFPYNLVLVVPFFALAVLRFWDLGAQALVASGVAGAWMVGLLVFAHGVPFLTATLRHMDWTNNRQEALMALAERMTDPHKDRVFDASGLVVTRWSIGRHWYLHSLNMGGFRNGAWEGIADMMRKDPPSVLLMSYRTDWLDPQDVAFIQANYVPFADDFWALGAILETGRDTWTCLKAGRYVCILVDPEGRPTRTVAPVRVDGNPQTGPISLALGPHHLQPPAGFRVGVIWLGPELKGLPALSPSRHERLFVNWY